jgi:hypothetical protein
MVLFSMPIFLVMPTALTAQNGAIIHQSTPISVSNCPKPKTKPHTASKATTQRASSAHAKETK